MKYTNILCVLLLFGCAGTPDVVSPTAPMSDAHPTIQDVVSSLRGMGLQVESAGTVEQPFFVVPAQVFTVGGDDLQLYEFATDADAQRAAAQVSPNGGAIGTTAMSWMAPPHFYRKGRLIANYLGSSPPTLDALQRLFGAQFAGQ